MTLSRRGFLGGLLVAAVAPAIIRTPGILMPIKPSLVPKPYVVFAVDLAVPGDSCSMMLRTAGGSFLPVEAHDGSIIIGMCRTILQTNRHDLAPGAAFVGDVTDINALQREILTDHAVYSDCPLPIQPIMFRGVPVIERSLGLQVYA